MPNKLSIFKFVRTVVIGTVLIGLLFGTVGFLIAGRVGFENMFIFGLAIGLIIVLVLSFAMVIQAYSSETFGNTRFKLLEYGWFVKTTDDNGNAADNKK